MVGLIVVVVSISPAVVVSLVFFVVVFLVRVVDGFSVGSVLICEGYVV